jgi:phosphoglycolate phosphatase
MTAAFTAQGEVAPDLPRTLSIVGLSLPEAIAQLAPDLPVAAQADIVAAYKASFMARRVQATAPLYPGARTALDRLGAQADLLLGVATGKSRRGLDHLLAAHELTGHFVTRQVADDHPSKPDPSMLRAALAETGVAAADAVMIGDTSFDMAMARAAGITGIGVAWGYHAAADLVAAGASVIVTDFPALERHLDLHWAEPA